MASPINNSPAEIVAALLVQLGEGTAPVDPPGVDGAWPVYCASEPNEPDNCITVYDTVNQLDGRAMIDGETWTHYGVQVRVRSQDHPTGYTKAFNIKLALAKNVKYVTVQVDSNSYIVHCLNKIGMHVLGKDSPNTKRSLFVVNALVTF